MTTLTTNEERMAQGTQHSPLTAWVEGLRKALESTAGEQTAPPMQAQVAPQGAWLAWPAPVWQCLELGSTAAIKIGAPRSTLEVLAQFVTGEQQLDEVVCENNFRELINQSAANFADSLSARLGPRQRFQPARPVEPPEASDYGLQVQFSLLDSDCIIAFIPNHQMIELLDAEQLPAKATTSLDLPEPGFANIDMLLEVELPVVVTFGRTQLPLKDVLKLSSGSIVELNRLVNEPVEVLINNCVVARGEVVVVDGIYGIRVTEIVSRQERIRSIF